MKGLRFQYLVIIKRLNANSDHLMWGSSRGQKVNVGISRSLYSSRGWALGLWISRLSVSIAGYYYCVDDGYNKIRIPIMLVLLTLLQDEKSHGVISSELCH